MPATLSTQPAQQLNTPELQRRVNALRTIDNVTNWFYLVREWLVVASVIALTIAFYQYRGDWGLHWVWNVPVTLLAITILGAGQHRLTNLTHEAAHYMLFRNRLLNEFVSDWCCMFPMLSTTHHYRLQHLAHHQFVNDPDRDPDVAQMEASGHRFRFPMARWLFVWKCVLKQILWVPGLIRYIRMRARYSATGGGASPYESRGKRSLILIVIGFLYLLALAGVVTALSTLEQPLLLAVVPAVMWAAIMVFYAFAPARLFRKTLVKPDIPPRWTAFLRVTHSTLLFTGLGWLSYLTDKPWGLYYLVLWVVPLATSFSFYMILRQIVQHGNAGQDRLTNTRVFTFPGWGRLIQLAVFPLGMDYHLPHHLFPMVPHYRLRQLHALLLETEAYRDHATVVEGYFFPHEVPPTHPTVLDLMSREPA